MSAQVIQILQNGTIDARKLSFGAVRGSVHYSLHAQGPFWALRKDGQEVRTWPNLIAGLSALERYSGSMASSFEVSYHG
jgi:hypothetical protein